MTVVRFFNYGGGHMDVEKEWASTQKLMSF